MTIFIVYVKDSQIFISKCTACGFRVLERVYKNVIHIYIHSLICSFIYSSINLSTIQVTENAPTLYSLGSMNKLGRLLWPVLYNYLSSK